MIAIEDSGERASDMMVQLLTSLTSALIITPEMFTKVRHAHMVAVLATHVCVSVYVCVCICVCVYVRIYVVVMTCFVINAQGANQQSIWHPSICQRQHDLC